MWIKSILLLLLFSGSFVIQVISQDSQLKKIEDLTNEFKKQYSIDANLAKKIANDAYIESLKVTGRLKDSVIGECSKNLGIAYEIVGMYDSAVWYYIEAEKKAEKTNNLELKQKVLNNLGIVYFTNNDFDKAQAYFQKSADVSLEDNDVENALLSMKNVLAISLQQENRALFWKTYKKADSLVTVNGLKDFAEELDKTKTVFLSKDDPEKAILFFKENIKKSKQEVPVNSLDLALSYRNLSAIYLNKGKPELAMINLDSSLQYSRLSGSLNDQKKSLTLKIRAEIELYLKEDAINDFNNLNLLLDSISKLSSSRAIAEMQTKYDTEKKEKENELLKKENELSELENLSRKRQARYMIIGLSVAFVLLIIILNRFMLTRRQKLKIEKQKELIEAEKKEVEFQKQKTEEQKLIVEDKNHEIMSSINYAKRIQTAILKEEQHVTPTFPEHFILFLPKDVVSGDFYWALEKGDNIYITAADCTGHGVPGAFMSMLGVSFLNEINNTEEMLSPAQILNILREKIIKELGQTGDIEGSKDGMDMSLIRINKKEKEIAWAGANNPLYIIYNNELIDYKGDRQPVGYSDKKEAFTDHRIELKEGMCFYLFSDGYQDQFGGPQGKKYKAKNLQKKLMEIHKRSTNEQKELLHQEFLSWRGDIEQIDDVCLIGLKL